MAQTRAGAKAFRNRLAWVAVLAGYRPTPAEEMVDVESIREQSQTEHYCHEHNTAFFKRGKMKSFAHPIGDTGEWCYERSPFASTEPKEKKSKDKEKEEPPTKSESEHSEPEKITGSISWETVYPKVNTLFKNKVGDWTMDGILAKMAGLGADISSNKFHVSFETLTDENKAQFSAMANKALQGKEGKLL